MGEARRALVDVANAIIEEYQDAGYDLTLRQLYYQFVARDILPNTEKSYKNLGDTINEGRLLGLIDWDAIEDRTRNLVRHPAWDDPAHMMESIPHAYREDPWRTQPCRVEVWVEKEALVGVVSKACEQWRVPYFACRGYVSQSEMWAAGQRLVSNATRFVGGMLRPQRTLVLHLGDHDPSGLDMSRDIKDRLHMFMEEHSQYLRFVRLGLNMDQIEELNPPPNPAKLTDSRASHYVEEWGDESWELDALPPDQIVQLIEEAVRSVIDMKAWHAAGLLEGDNRDILYAAKEWVKSEMYLRKKLPKSWTKK